MAHARSLTHQPLLERESELEEIAGAVEVAASGQGRLVLVEAAAGLGKTSLLEAALASARDQGLCALSARGSELEREFPFGVVRQLLEPRVAARGEDEREPLFAGAAALSRPLFERFVEAPGGGLADPTYPTLHGLYWLLSNLSCERPLALAVDDAHWADLPSLRFLAFLLPRLEGLPVALIVALRTAEPQADEDPLGRLASAPEALHVRPRPLSKRAVRELVAAGLDAQPAAEFSHACHEAAAGNPFYLQSLLAELSAHGVEPSAQNAARVRSLGPRAVSRAVLLRLSALDPDAPALARAATVLGDGAALSEAAELAGIDEQRAATIADLLAQGAILKRGRRLEFVHPIVREAVYSDLAPQERSAQHAQAARVLIASRAAPERVAAQIQGAEVMGEDWVVEQLREAANRAQLTGAAEVAAGYLRRALDEPLEGGLRAELLLELGRAEAAAGEPDALEQLHAAIELAGDADVQASAAFELGRALLYLGRPGEAADILQHALESVPDAAPPVRRQLEAVLLTLVQTTVSARRLVVERLRLAESALQGSHPRRPEVLATVAVEKAIAEGPAEEAAQLATQALEEEHLLEELSAEAPAVYFATSALTLADRGDVSERHLGRAILDARRQGSARGFAFASCFRGWGRYRCGDLSGAEADLQAFVELAAELSLDIIYPFGLGALVQVLLERGQREAAITTLARHDPARWDPDSVLFQELRAAKARLFLREGKSREALSEALEIAAWEQAWGARHDAWTRWRPLAALAHAALGEREQAGRIAGEAVDLARSFGARDYLGITLRVAGTLDERDTGEKLLEEAVSSLSRSQASLEHARALVDLGSALRRSNRRPEAREPLSRGLELAQRCGATPLVDRAGEELEATGSRPGTPVVGGLGALTPSERRIVQMAADGLSNPEIAQALFVSLKTVETHLSHAYRKLQVRSRSDLPRVLESEL